MYGAFSPAIEYDWDYVGNPVLDGGLHLLIQSKNDPAIKLWCDGLVLIPSQVRRSSSTMEKGWLGITTHYRSLLLIQNVKDEMYPSLSLLSKVLFLVWHSVPAQLYAWFNKFLHPLLFTSFAIPFARTLCAIVVWNEGSEEVKGAELPQSCSHLCAF